MHQLKLVLVATTLVVSSVVASSGGPLAAGPGEGGSFAAAPGAAPTPLLSFPARVQELAPPVEMKSYPVYDGAGNKLGETQWRVVRDTGNCCENYLVATLQGRLLDFGGTYLHYSDDKGLTWNRVLPTEPLLNGEGAVAVAPGGDIVAVAWEPYTGDRVVAFKYEAATKQWSYVQTILHTPFFDRPWLAVVPGPFTFAGTTYPYLTILEGGVGLKKDLWYYSFDGLNYVLPDSKNVDALTTGRLSRWLKAEGPDPETDWLQPHSESGIAPLPRGGGIAAWTLIGLSDFALLEPPEIQWHAFDFPEGDMVPTKLIADSLGRLHSLTYPRQDATSFTYATSFDGGKTWTEKNVALPAGYVLEKTDIKASAEYQIAAVAVHAGNAQKKTDQDFVYKFSVAESGPQLTRLYYVGQGDAIAGSGATYTGERFDFANVAILRDGTIATSFGDSQHTDPAVAIEISSPGPAPGPGPSPSPTGPPPPNPSPSPSATQGPRSTITEPRHRQKLNNTRLHFLRGTASGGAAGVDRVMLALRRKSDKGCKWWNGAKRRLVKRSCSRPLYFKANDREEWDYAFLKPLPPGRYQLRSRAVDELDRREPCCRKGRNLIKFTLK